MIRRKEYIVERTIHDSIYLINIKQNYLNDKCCLYEINEMGSFIWNRISKGTSIDSIMKAIMSEIDVEGVNFEEISNDVRNYVDLLVKEGFLEVYNGGE